MNSIFLQNLQTHNTKPRPKKITHACLPLFNHLSKPTCQSGLFSWWMTTVHWWRRAHATIASLPPKVPCSERLARWSSKLMSSSTNGSKSSLKLNGWVGREKMEVEKSPTCGDACTSPQIPCEPCAPELSHQVGHQGPGTGSFHHLYILSSWGWTFAFRTINFIFKVPQNRFHFRK